MSAAMISALFFTVALLVTTTYFILGSIPLLVLKHDTPLDARFVRGFFDIYYVAAVVTVSFPRWTRSAPRSGPARWMQLRGSAERTSPQSRLTSSNLSLSFGV